MGGSGGTERGLGAEGRRVQGSGGTERGMGAEAVEATEGATGGYLWGVFEGSSWALPGRCRLTETRVSTGPEFIPFCAKLLKRHLFWVHKNMYFRYIL